MAILLSVLTTHEASFNRLNPSALDYLKPSSFFREHIRHNLLTTLLMWCNLTSSNGMRQMLQLRRHRGTWPTRR